MDDKLRAALYERVSTLEQASEGYSLGAQDEKLIKHAEYKGCEVYGRYVDDGYSGSSLERPAVKRLIADVDAGRIDIVLVYKLDRLSRRVKDVLELLELFERKGVTLYSLTENIDLSSAFGRAALKMAATFSELERENIIERTAMGRAAKAASGLYSCHGRPPFGYDFDKAAKVFTVNAEEAEIVRDIFARYIDGLSLRQVNDYCLARYKLPCFRNEAFAKSVIRRSLYAGFIELNGRTISVGNVEPIIAPETFIKARRRARENAKRRTRDNSPYLLSGLIYCGVCGNRFVGKRRSHYATENGCRILKYSYAAYGCAARLKSGRGYPKAKCDNRIISADKLEEYVGRIIDNLDIAVEPQTDAASPDQARIVAEIEALNKKRGRLLELYLENGIDKRGYTRRAAELTAEIDKLRAAAAGNAEGARIERTDSAAAMLKAMLAAYRSADKREKRRLLEILVNKIVVTYDRIDIFLNVDIIR